MSGRGWWGVRFFGAWTCLGLCGGCRRSSGCWLRAGCALDARGTEGAVWTGETESCYLVGGFDRHEVGVLWGADYLMDWEVVVD